MKRHFLGLNALDRYYPVGCDKAVVDAEDDDVYHTKSLLSIVADSSTVDVWILENADMNYLTPMDQERVFDNIAMSREADRPHHPQDIDFIVEQFQKWDNYKVDCVEALFDRVKMEKYFKG